MIKLEAIRRPRDSSPPIRSLLCAKPCGIGPSGCFQSPWRCATWLPKGYPAFRYLARGPRLEHGGGQWPAWTLRIDWRTGARRHGLAGDMLDKRRLMMGLLLALSFSCS